MIPRRRRNRLLKQVLIAIIGIDFTCGGGRGNVRVPVLLLERKRDNWPRPTMSSDILLSKQTILIDRCRCCLLLMQSLSEWFLFTESFSLRLAVVSFLCSIKGKHMTGVSKRLLSGLNIKISCLQTDLLLVAPLRIYGHKFPSWCGVKYLQSESIWLHISRSFYCPHLPTGSPFKKGDFLKSLLVQWACSVPLCCFKFGTSPRVLHHTALRYFSNHKNTNPACGVYMSVRVWTVCVSAAWISQSLLP